MYDHMFSEGTPKMDNVNMILCVTWLFAEFEM